MIRSSVDLPPPLGPRMPIRAPASTSRSAPRRIARPPKDLVRPRAASSGTAWPSSASVAGVARVPRQSSQPHPSGRDGTRDPHRTRADEPPRAAPSRTAAARSSRSRRPRASSGPAAPTLPELPSSCAGCSCRRRASSRGSSASARRRTSVHVGAPARTRRRSPSTRSRCCSPACAGSPTTRGRRPGTRATTASLEGSTVAIVGAGGIGRELIRMLEPHDVEIVAVTRSGARRHAAGRRGSARCGARADHFVIAAPATDATRHLVGAPSSRRCSRTRGSSTSPAGR